MVSLHRMTPALYEQTWRQLCVHWPGSAFVRSRIFSALILDGSKALRNSAHKPSDTEELILHRIVHHHGHGLDETCIRDFEQLLVSAGPALCSLRAHYPGIVRLLGLPARRQKQLITSKPLGPILEHLVPADWPDAKAGHIWRLLRSLEIWLYAAYCCLKK